MFLFIHYTRCFFDGTISFWFFLFCSSFVLAWQPYADSVTTGLFLQDSGHTIPDKYFRADPVNGTSFILTRRPYGTSTCSDPINAGPMSWTISNLNYPSSPSKYDELSSGYPGFSENGVPRGQCVAFAKVATNTEGYGTARWYAGNGNVQSSGVYFALDNSSQHRGEMIAYFPSGSGSRYPNGTNGYGHVGIFLKYHYPNPPYNTTYSMPIGFWIVDENFSGNGLPSNTDGKIRKHLISFSGGSQSRDGSKYYFVDIR